MRSRGDVERTGVYYLIEDGATCFGIVLAKKEFKLVVLNENKVSQSKLQLQTPMIVRGSSTLGKGDF